MKLQLSADFFFLARMFSFRSVLQQLMIARKLKQQELGDRVGIAQSQISKYLSGSLPDVETLTKLCAAFPEDALALIAAFLKDQTPKEWQSSVQIRAVAQNEDHRTREDSPVDTPPWPELSLHLRQLITNAIEECGNSYEFLAALEALIALSKRKS